MKTSPILRGALSVAAIVAIIVGVPLALGWFVGWPLPTSTPSLRSIWTSLQASDVPDVVIVDGLAIVVWLAWLQVVTALGIEVAAVLRGRLAQHVRGFGPAQALATLLVGGVLLLSLPQRSVPAHRPLELVLAVEVAPTTAGTSTIASTDAIVETPAHEVYTVQRRDNLWQIAADRLGDAKRWPEIFALNQGKAQPDGGALVRPELIRPGWKLELPTVLSATSMTAAPSSDTSTSSTGGVPTDQLTLSTTTPSNAVPSVAVAGTAESNDAVASQDDSSPDQLGTATSVVLASGSVVGIGLASSIAAALVTLRRRRRLAVPQAPLADVVYQDESISNGLRQLRRAALLDDDQAEVERQPGVVAVGERAGVAEQVRLSDVGVTRFGDDELDEARAFVLTHLLGSSAIDAEVRVVGVALAEELLGATDSFEGLSIDADLDAVLTSLEGELVGGARLFEMVGVDSLDELREVSPADRIAVTVVVTRNPLPEQLARLEAVVDQGKQFGICALVIGDTAGERVADLDVSYRLNQKEATEITELVAEVRTWDRQAEDVEPLSTEPFVAPEVTHQSTVPVLVRVFGSPAVVVNGEEVQASMRSKSVELIAYLATRPNGVPGDVAAAVLWPEANGKQAGERFATANSDVRRVLRRETDVPHGMFIERTNSGYRLDANLVSCDLWDFEAALTDVVAATGDASRSVVALERVVATYEAHFCDEAPYEWADDVREHFRRRALDVYTLLSEAYEARGERMRTLTVLERAMTLDPYREDVYQRVMRIQCETEQFAAAQRTGELIVSRLSSINLEPLARTRELIAAARQTVKRPLAG